MFVKDEIRHDTNCAVGLIQLGLTIGGRVGGTRRPSCDSAVGRGSQSAQRIANDDDDNKLTLIVVTCCRIEDAFVKKSNPTFQWRLTRAGAAALIYFDRRKGRFDALSDERSRRKAELLRTRQTGMGASQQKLKETLIIPDPSDVEEMLWIALRVFDCRERGRERCG